MKIPSSFVRTFTALAALMVHLPVSSVAQCGYFNGTPLITYLGCATANDQAYGRTYRIAVPLHCYNNCGAALPGYPIVRAVNLRTGYSVDVWAGGCGFYLGNGAEPCAGTAVGGFTLLDRDFLPDDEVRIDTLGRPSSSDAPVICTTNAANFHYPPALVPEIVQQPQDETVSPSSAAIFRIAAAPGITSYEWRRNGVPIVGANGAVLVVEAANAVGGDSYDVRVRNDCGAALSGAAMLNIAAEGPLVSRLPLAQTVCEGGIVDFSVEASFAQSLSFQWLHNDVPIPGATSATLVLSNVTPANAGSYRASVIGGGVLFTTVGAILTVLEAPRITRQPQSAIVCQVAPVSLSVAVTGAPPFLLQWRLNGTPIPGATNMTLNGLSSEFPAGNYNVVAANACGSVTSATATVSALRSVLRPDGRALIEWSDPFDALQCSSNLMDWVELPGATSPYLVPAGEPSSRFYRLHCGDSTPTILRQPDSAIVNAGDRLVIFGTAEGPAPLSYQWLFNGTNLTGATSSTLVLSSVQRAQVGVYELRVSNGYGAVTSQVAYVYILNDTGGVAFNTVVASPALQLLLLRSENLTGLPFNTTVAQPPIQTLLLRNENLTGLSFNTTVAQPSIVVRSIP